MLTRWACLWKKPRSIASSAPMISEATMYIHQTSSKGNRRVAVMVEAADSSRWPEIGYNFRGLRVVSCVRVLSRKQGDANDVPQPVHGRGLYDRGRSAARLFPASEIEP